MVADVAHGRARGSVLPTSVVYSYNYDCVGLMKEVGNGGNDFLARHEFHEKGAGMLPQFR